MQKLIALIVILAVSSSLQQPVTTGEQAEVQTEEQTVVKTELKTEDDSAANSIKFIIPFFTANWFKAVEYCNYLGHRLAVIDTKEKEAQLYAVVKASDIYTNASNIVWVGANDLADEGNFHWHETGKRVLYANWGGGQPDNADRSEHCVEVGQYSGMTWQWNDRNCKTNRYFVCEDYKQ